ncbi:MAG: MBOAT family protein [Lachnospiraceae bacterium]|nr:MBOAT family protein [Lachnospiraceae bacterium]
MVFSSVIFLCFFLPAVVLGYHLLPKKARNVWLLIASLGFYACGGPRHLIYLISSIVFNFLIGIALSKLAPKDEGGTHPASQKAVLAGAVIVNIGSLIYFKYTGMILDSISALSSRNIDIPSIILPIGISFYSFQCVSYIIDVYRGEGTAVSDLKGTRHSSNLLDFALYVTFFPQLLQGPIIRYPDVKDALESPVITLEGNVRGIERFIIGLAKKAIIANTLGEVSEKIFAIETGSLSSSVAWLGAVLYTLQIYFDFAGYTDMAIGLGRLFGIPICENFNYPYISKSITEFWRRWHISLSNWFRDYLYIPLGGNRRGNVYVNLLVVFLATGIWHGAAWGFIVWGLWHGLFMLIERALKGKKAPIRLPSAISSLMKWGYTMLAVTLGWVLFRIEDLPASLSYIKVMFGLEKHEYSAFSVRFFLDARLWFFLIIAVIACVPWARILPRYAGERVAALSESNAPLPRIARHAGLIVLLVISFIFIVNTTYSPFIYFQF